jgi:hypothetical protein
VKHSPDVATGIKAALEQAARCVAAETSDNYGDLDAQLEALDGAARMTVQARLDIPSLLKKLKQQESLGPADWKTLELLIVGDAECFVKYEADLDRWKGEVGQLIAEIGKLQSPPLDVDGLLHLRALCQELRRVVPAIVYYLEQKERAAKFQQASHGSLDAEGYRVLAEIMSAMLASAKM